MVTVLIQVGAIKELVDLLGPTNFLILATLYVFYQVYSPQGFPKTKFQKITDSFRQEITGIEDSLNERLDLFEEKQMAHIQLTRAIASVKNPAEEIDDEVVDDYLVKNGVKKEQFLLGEEADDNKWGGLTDEQVSDLQEHLDRQSGEDESRQKK